MPLWKCFKCCKKNKKKFEQKVRTNWYYLHSRDVWHENPLFNPESKLTLNKDEKISSTKLNHQKPKYIIIPVTLKNKQNKSPIIRKNLDLETYETEPWKKNRELIEYCERWNQKNNGVCRKSICSANSSRASTSSSRTDLIRPRIVRRPISDMSYSTCRTSYSETSV